MTTKENKQRCSIYSINPQKGIIASLKSYTEKPEHVVVLCLSNRVIQTSFPSREAALCEIARYKALYRPLKK